MTDSPRYGWYPVKTLLMSHSQTHEPSLLPRLWTEDPNTSNLAKSLVFRRENLIASYVVKWLGKAVERSLRPWLRQQLGRVSAGSSCES